MKKKILVDIIAMLYIVLFVYAAINKIYTRPLFEAQMRKAHLLEMISVPMSYIVPIVELIISVLLITTKYKLKALWAATGLMLLFTIYIILILMINKETPCGCGGIIQKLDWPQHIVMNITFIIVGIIAILLERKNPSTENTSPTIVQL